MAPNTGAAARLLLRQKQSQRGMIRPSPPAAATASAASLRVDYTGAGGINCGRCCHDKCLFFSQKTRSIWVDLVILNHVSSNGLFYGTCKRE